ncbi:hypothetical protein G7025_26485 [Pseudomonas lurida]|nr:MULTISPECIES: hypothetical protein [Pseudomonas]MBA1296899.1 hypothetical protein [Pseudomonas lurida]
MAGEIRGKQVSLTALRDDITNETTAIQVRDGVGMRTLTDGSDANLTAGRVLNVATF